MAEEFRDDEKLVIMAHLPGLDPDRDIEVSVSGDVLHIRAQREDGAGVPDSDLRDGPFVRDIALPPGTDTPQVSAHYTDQVLEVRAPLGAPKGATRIVPVTGGLPSGSPP